MSRVLRLAALLFQGAMPAIVLSVLLAPACGSSPVAPSGEAIPTRTSAATVAPTSTSGLSPFVGTWNVTVTPMEVGDGGGCVGDTMRSRIGMPTTYSLTITEADVTLTNPSNSRACKFNGPFRTDGSSFTTTGTGTYWCEPWVVTFRCSDGSEHQISTFGEDIAGSLTDGAISGTWAADWFKDDEGEELLVVSRYTGRK